MTVSPGSRLGHYEIVSPLGAGGMGEVFRARDTKLGREVALKLVLQMFVDDHDRLVRFEREARTLASLNHPGIATLHGLEQATPSGAASPVHFLVMELVEGETLAERIARRLTLDEAVNIARQIAEALEAAHEKGIIHRDLKPANVKITPDDKVKVLDFGLAKAVDAAGGAGGAGGGSVLNSPTMSAMATAQGVILGTAAYMSPEQARGAQADHRSDIFSFGIVLYEMLTGRHPFPGETVSDVLASVLVREPDLSALPQDLSPRLLDLVRRCLEKQPKRRWQAIGDVRHELEVIAISPRATAPVVQTMAAPPPRPVWKRVMPVAIAAIVASGITGGVVWTMRPAVPPAVVTRFPLGLGEGQNFFSVDRPGVAVSPDGKRLAYVANLQVYVRSLSELDASPVKATSQGTAIPSSIVFSPDGRSIAYWQAGQIKTAEIAGGAPVTICPAAESPGGMSWSGDTLLFPDAKGIMRVPASGGQPEVLVPLENRETALRPQMLPGGNAVLFTLASGLDADRWEKAKIVVQSLETSTRTTLVEGGSDARYVPSGLGSQTRADREGGHLVYAVSGVVFARPFDVSRLAVTGGAISVVEGVRRGLGVGRGMAQFSVSDTGTLAYVPGPAASDAANLKLVLVDRSGATEFLNVPPGPYSVPRMSPDGRTIAFGRDDGRDVSIWVYDLSGAGSARRLTFGGRDRYPVWTADSQRVVFQSDREGDLALFWQRADQTGIAERLTKPEKGVEHVAQSASPNGAVLLVDQVADGESTLFTLLLKDRTLARFGGVESTRPTGAIFSPDGRWVAYSTREAERQPTAIIVFVQPFPATGAKSQVSSNIENGHHQVWSSDGKELFYTPGGGNRLAGVTVSTTPGFAFGAAPAVNWPFTTLTSTYQRPYDAARGGKRFLGLTSGDETNPAVTSNQIQVVLNWFDELRARAPLK